MSSLITPAPAVHNDPTAKADEQAQLQAAVASLQKMLASIAPNILGLIGSELASIFSGIDITVPGAVLAAIDQAVASLADNLEQQIIDAIVVGLTGVASSGNTAASIIQAFLGLATAPVSFFDQVLAQLAAQQAQITAIQNNPTGASQTDNFLATDLSNWTSVTGPLLLSTVGSFIQTAYLSAGYIGTSGSPRKPLGDKHGAQIVLDGQQQGATRLWIAGDAAMDNYAAVEVYSGFSGDALRIMTGSSPSLAVIQKQLDIVTTDHNMITPSRLQNLTAIDLRYDPGTNTFTVLRNGQDVGLSWQDTGNIVTHGSTKRIVGVVSNALNDSRPGFFGFGIKQLTFYDW